MMRKINILLKRSLLALQAASEMLKTATKNLFSAGCSKELEMKVAMHRGDAFISMTQQLKSTKSGTLLCLLRFFTGSVRNFRSRLQEISSCENNSHLVKSNFLFFWCVIIIIIIKLQNIYRRFRLRSHRLVLDGEVAEVDSSEFEWERAFVRDIWKQEMR